MSLRFMLDTDTVSFALRGEGGVKSRLLQERQSAVCISSSSRSRLEVLGQLLRLSDCLN